MRIWFPKNALMVKVMTLYYDLFDDVEQLSLFPDLPATTLAPVGRTHFLTSLAQLMGVFSRSTILNELIREAVSSTPDVGGQAWGTEVESEIGRRVQNREWRGKIQSDFLELSKKIDTHSYAFPCLVEAKFEFLEKTGSPCDLILNLRFSNRATYSVMINVKGLTGSETLKAIGHGLSLGTFLRLMTEKEFDPRQSQNKSYDSDLALLEMLTGTRKILSGRDYYLLLVRADRGNRTSAVSPILKSISFQSLLASLDDKGIPVISRHHSREIVQVSVAKSSIPPGYDLNRRIAEALLPISRGGDLRIRMATLLAKHQPGKMREHVLAVMALSDAEIIERIVRA